MAMTAQEMLDKYLDAEAAVLEGKEINFNGRKLVRADLPQIIAGRKEWERRVNAQAAAARGNQGYSLATFR